VNDDVYEGPPVKSGPKAVENLRARVAGTVRERAQEIHRNKVMEWAAANSGTYPSCADAVEQAREEIEVLCRGLGEWAAVRAANVFVGPYEDWLAQLLDER